MSEITKTEKDEVRNIFDPITGGEIILEYNCDGDYYVFCNCGGIALLDDETDTYICCVCGWESINVYENPDKFMDLEYAYIYRM